MITYEVNILCDGEDCSEIITGEPIDKIHLAIESASEWAKEEGWHRFKGKWFCEDCYRARQK